MSANRNAAYFVHLIISIPFSFHRRHTFVRQINVQQNAAFQNLENCTFLPLLENPLGGELIGRKWEVVLCQSGLVVVEA